MQLAQPQFTPVSLNFLCDFLKTLTISIRSLVVLQLNNDISEQIYASIFTFLLGYVLIRALNQALQCPFLGVAEEST
jgi:hypothetical protein